MEYRKMGRSGLKLSALSFGSWVTFGRQVDSGLAERMFGTCLDAGVNFFDNAEGYEAGASEEVMGRALKALARPRDSYCVSSKVFFGGCENPTPTQRGLSRKHVTEACHDALRRLQVDYLDLYFCHRPDPDTPVDETVWTMHNLIIQGKVLYWGTSEWPIEKIIEACEFAQQNHLIPPSMEQPQYNLLARHRVEQEYLPAFEQFGLGATTWSPLASGVLSGKYQQGVPDDSRLSLPGYEWLRDLLLEGEGATSRLERVARLVPLAESVGITLSQLAIAWCLRNPHVSTVILGASRVDQLEENLRAIDAVSAINDDITREIDQVTA
ncbi:MAG: aldo/keto reductase [Halieaceae bacterium]|nr:aldo/keto reductase [Halieaceae bacterium]